MIVSVATLTRWIEKWLSTLVILVVAGTIAWFVFDAGTQVYQSITEALSCAGQQAVPTDKTCPSKK